MSSSWLLTACMCVCRTTTDQRIRLANAYLSLRMVTGQNQHVKLSCSWATRLRRASGRHGSVVSPTITLINTAVVTTTATPIPRVEAIDSDAFHVRPILCVGLEVRLMDYY